ncbi:hypothetical protein GCM10022243_28480 [Saccharothrix violaceirubra]|uniref:Uncharacterized protein n=1 Tax=Saccharothrix violaceirubra TaxID=413306 RepID=A0A7W7WZE8_9PSEU|nr:hypothetical protein [Saccharothrix violaceirubra]MBB4969227.1 hypothetical protein [Saccharothrix violaceirubra]
MARPGLSVVAAAGVCLVAYSFLVGLWPSRSGADLDLVLLVRSWVNLPTGLGEDFGFLGIALLLLVVGTRAERAVPRRAVLPVAAGVVLTAVLALAGAEPLVDDSVITPALTAGLALLLVNVVKPLLRRAPALAAFVLVEVACLLVLLGTAAGLPLLAAAAGLVPVVVWGLLAALRVEDRVSTRHLALVGLPGFAVLVAADRLSPDTLPFWRPLGAVYAVLLFAIALPRGADLAGRAAVRWLADRAVVLVVAVIAIGYPLLGLLGEVLPAAVTVVVGVLVTGVAGDLAYRGLRRVT